MMMIMMVGMMGLVCMVSVCLSMLAFGAQFVMGSQTVPQSSGETSPEDNGTTATGADGDVLRAPPGCVYLYDNVDGTGEPLQVCLDGRDEWSIYDLKDYDYDNKPSAMDVGQGVSAKVYEHPGFNLSQEKYKDDAMLYQRNPEWVNLRSRGMDGKVSSIKVFKR
jgi:hypothetical protein